VVSALRPRSAPAVARLNNSFINSALARFIAGLLEYGRIEITA
jgi:hypothetical protein